MPAWKTWTRPTTTLDCQTCAPTGVLPAQAGRHREALEQFRHVDGYVDALPWHYTGYRRIYYRAIRTAAARGALIESLRR